MGQKVSPHGLRVGVIKDWNSKWYADKSNFAEYLAEDQKVRNYTKKKLYVAGVSKVLIERPANNKIKVIVMTAKPGMVIGRAGDGIDALRKGIVKITGKEVEITILEVKRAEMDAQLTAESVAQALEKRIAFRRAMKQAIGRTMKSGAKGIKILCSGRLGGAEIARSEKYSEGNVPLHTIRADIDYGFAEADTTYGKIGVKVWINHGEILEKGLQSAIPQEKEDKRSRRDNGEKRSKKSDGERRPRRDNNKDAKAERPKAANMRVRPKKVEAPVAETVEAPVEENTEVTE